MNKVYKLVFNKRTGFLVVASEQAKGLKKSTVKKNQSPQNNFKKLINSATIILSSFIFIESAIAAEYVNLYPSYSSGTLIKNPTDDSVTGIDSTDTANYQFKMHLLGTGNGTITSTNGKFVIDLKQSTLFLPNQDGPKIPLPTESLDLDELYSIGAVTIREIGSNENLTELPTWKDWNLNAEDAKQEVTWEKTDGSTGTVLIYNIDNIYIPEQNVDSLNYSKQRLTGQPTQPFYQLSFAKINEGELDLQGDAIDWKPGQVKQSSFFIAEGSNAKINVNTPIKVTFESTESIESPASVSYDQKIFGPKKTLSGSTLNVDGQSFTINSVDALKAYNNALQQAITDNKLAASEYQRRFNQAFKVGRDLYQLTYDPMAGYENQTGFSNIYFSPEMKAIIGKRSIFEASQGGTIVLNQDVQAIGQTWAHAYNVYLHDGGLAINNGKINVSHKDTQNALVQSGSKFENNGTLNFNVPNGGTNWADQVQDVGSEYINNGVISVSTSAKHSANSFNPNEHYSVSRNIALEVLDGASAENSTTGKFYIGTEQGTGTATGVHIKEHGQFTNNGKMYIGKNANGDDEVLAGGSKSETLDVVDTYSAVSAYIEENTQPIRMNNFPIRIDNNGLIDINDTAKNAVAINVGFKNAANSTSDPIDVEVNNTGTINVYGTNSAGLKASGFQTVLADGIKNTGTINVGGESSSGIFSTDGASIVNDGKIIVNGSSIPVGAKNRPYGVRTDNALVTLTDNSEITLLGHHAVGLYARVGGEIKVEGGTINVPVDPAAIGQTVFWISGKNDVGQSSRITFNQPTTFSLENNSSTLFRIDSKATYIADASNAHTMNINGKGSTGYYITDKGTEFNSGQSTIQVNGNGATGIYVNGGAGLDNKVILSQDTNLNIVGNQAFVAVIDGQKYDIVGNPTELLGAKLISEATLTSGSGGNVADNAIGYWLLNTGELEHKGSIDFTEASNATGVKVEGGRLNNTSTGTILVNGVGIDVLGENSVVENSGIVHAQDGIAAIRLNEGTSLTLVGSSTSNVLGEGSADAVRVHAGANLTTENANIEVKGNGSGIHFLNTAGSTNKEPFKLSGDGIITVSGNNAAGITLEAEDANGQPTMSTSDLDTTGSENLVINVLGDGGNGIVTNTSGSVKSGTSVNIASANGQSALVVLGETQNVEQSGILTSNSTTSAIVDLTQVKAIDISFTNSGNIVANGGAGAIDARGQNADVAVVNKGSGLIIGDVLLSDSNNTFTNQDSAIVQGSVIAGNGQNTVILKDQSQIDSVMLGDGGNTIDIYGGSKNGSLQTGGGEDQFNLIAVNLTHNDDAFTLMDAGGGVDTLNLKQQSHYVLNDPSKIANFENLHIQDNSIFEVNNVDLVLNDAGNDTNVVEVDAGSTYFINFDQTTQNYELAQKVSGAGTIKTDTNNQAFDFSSQSSAYSKDNFIGTLALGNGTFDINSNNADALSNATLQLDANGIASFNAQDGIKRMGGLSFNDGGINFEKDIIGSNNETDGYILVKDLNVEGKGYVNVITDGFDNDYTEEEFLEDVSKKTLLEQDDGINMVTLVKAATSVVGDANQIDINLMDATGTPIAQLDSLQDIRQDGNVVAVGTYGVGSSIYNDQGEKDGLYAAYRLKEVAIKDGETLNLESTPTATEKGQEFRAKITDLNGGSGSIEINSNAQAISLSNSLNDYTGSTIVNTGTLKLVADTVLGQQDKHTSELILKENTAVEFGETTQYIGAIQTAQNSNVDLQDGVLNVENGGLIAGNLASESNATLNVNSGELTVKDANTDFHAQTNVANNAVVNIENTAGLGDGKIDLAGTLNINDTSGIFANQLSNSGSTNLNGQSNLILTGDNTDFSGTFNISKESALTTSQSQHLGNSEVNNEGKLIVDGNEDWILNNIVQGSGDLYKKGVNTVELTENSAKYTGNTFVEQGTLIAGTQNTPIELQSKQLNISSGATFAGVGSTAGNVNNQGSFIVGGVDKDISSVISHYQVKGDFDNAGKIVLGGESGTGSTLNINGNYISNGGSLHINTVLNKGQEETQTDQLIVGGNVLQGSGGATSIYVKPVGNGLGAYTQPNAIKVVSVGGDTAKSAFTLGSPVAIGVYEYRLHQGTNDNSWYLSSSDVIDPPTTGGDNNYLNPMIGAYFANQNALGMFNMTLHDRLGEPQYSQALKSNQNANSVWVRSVINHEKYKTLDRQLKIDGDTELLQIGADVIHWDQWSNNSNYRGRLGVMGGLGQRDFESTSSRTGTKAYGKIDNAYSLGIYGTIYQDTERPLDSYLDAWALYNWYDDNKVGMDGYQSSKYDSRGYNVSLEAGHTFIVADILSKQKQWHVQPQLQVTYGELRTDASSNDSGISLEKNTSDSLESRLGARIVYATQAKSNYTLQPFAEVNWLRQYKDNDLTFNQNYTFENDTPDNRYEVKIGFEGNSSKNWNGWGNISYTTGDESYRQVKAMAGFKYQW